MCNLINHAFKQNIAQAVRIANSDTKYTKKRVLNEAFLSSGFCTPSNAAIAVPETKPPMCACQAILGTIIGIARVLAIQIIDHRMFSPSRHCATRSAPISPIIAPEAPYEATNQLLVSLHHTISATLPPKPDIKYNPKNFHLPKNRSNSTPSDQRHSILKKIWVKFGA